jgi:hypothetical protein
MLVLYHSRQFAMSHWSYNSNLGSEILILVGDIRSRSWPNIDGTYGMYVPLGIFYQIRLHSAYMLPLVTSSWGSMRTVIGEKLSRQGKIGQ